MIICDPKLLPLPIHTCRKFCSSDKICPVRNVHLRKLIGVYGKGETKAQYACASKMHRVRTTNQLEAFSRSGKLDRVAPWGSVLNTRGKFHPHSCVANLWNFMLLHLESICNTKVHKWCRLVTLLLFHSECFPWICIHGHSELVQFVLFLPCLVDNRKFPDPSSSWAQDVLPKCL